MIDLRAAWRQLWGVEQKQSKAGPLFTLFGAGRPTPTPRRYERLAEEGFQKNAVVFRCVNLVSECAAAVPWTLFHRRGRSKERLDVHPLLTLLERPNPTQGGAAFFKAVYAYRLLSGNSYIEAVGPSDGPNAGRPRELWTLRPDRVQVVKGDKGQPAGFQFQAGGRTVTWRVDPVTGRSPVLHSKSFHPLDDWYGMSPLEAAAFEVDQHNAAGAWNYALLQNSGRPSGALVYDPGEGTHSDVLDGESLSDVLQGLEEDILRILTRLLVTEPLARGLTAGLGSFTGGGLGQGGGLEGLIGGGLGSLANLFPSPAPGVGLGTYNQIAPIAAQDVANPLLAGIFQSGGPVHGPGGPKGDRIPALLSDGEFVVNAEAARRYPLLLERLNADMPAPAYATGGAVAPFLRYVSADVRPPSPPPPPQQPRESFFAGRPVVVHINNPTSVPEIQRGMAQIRGSLREMLARAERRGE